MNINESSREVLARLEDILRRRKLPEASIINKTITGGTDSLLKEIPPTRPAARSGNPGGLVRLKSAGYFIIVPDLHGRREFFHAVMSWSGFSGRRIIDDMHDGYAQVICVGDAFHSESRGRERWKKAQQEWIGEFKKHRNMDAEMFENLGLLEMICTVKTAFPEQFHFLKGNHENIANEKGEGNFPFRKFAYEGDMVKLWVQKFMGMDLFDSVYQWEKALPLMAEGPDFLVTHCEPGRPVSRNEVINAYESPDLIYNLTWVDNNQAEQGSVSASLAAFEKPEYGRIFGGHRTVRDRYELRQDGRYVQINTPNTWVVGALTNMELFKPERDIIRIDTGENGGQNS